MDDLISRAAVLGAIDNERKLLIERKQYGAEHVIVHHARRMIEELPAVDAVPVVRCGECKYFTYLRGYCYLLMGTNGKNFYCADGKRREADEAD